MKKKRRAADRGSEEIEINMTPMIDIVFQLLIFFVLTAKFIEIEGELRSYLPKNRGLQQTVATTIDLDNVTLFLAWEGDPTRGRCIAITVKYRPPTGGEQNQFKFPTVPGGDAGYAANKKITYEYPNFNEIAAYVKYRKEAYAGIGFGLPVTVNFTDRVPIQMVVNMIDICVKLGITDFALNAQGID